MGAPIDVTRQDNLARWQRDGNLDALDGLLRSEIGALRDLVATHGQSILTGSTGPSDIAQQAVLRMLQVETPPVFQDVSSFRAYLWLTAWRLLLQRLRRPVRRLTRIDEKALVDLEDPSRTADIAQSLSQSERDLALQVAVNLLPDQDRELIELVYFEKLEVATVATRLGLTEAAASMRLTRARRKLAARLEAWKETLP